jgi:hypothetical protein
MKEGFRRKLRHSPADARLTSGRGRHREASDTPRAANHEGAKVRPVGQGRSGIADHDRDLVLRETFIVCVEVTLAS